jgi:hypothetical protein
MADPTPQEVIRGHLKVLSERRTQELAIAGQLVDAYNKRHLHDRLYGQNSKSSFPELMLLVLATLVVYVLDRILMPSFIELVFEQIADNPDERAPAVVFWVTPGVIMVIEFIVGLQALRVRKEANAQMVAEGQGRTPSLWEVGAGFLTALMPLLIVSGFLFRGSNLGFVPFVAILSAAAHAVNIFLLPAIYQDLLGALLRTRQRQLVGDLRKVEELVGKTWRDLRDLGYQGPPDENLLQSADRAHGDDSVRQWTRASDPWVTTNKTNKVKLIPPLFVLDRGEVSLFSTDADSDNQTKYLNGELIGTTELPHCVKPNPEGAVSLRTPSQGRRLTAERTDGVPEELARSP